MFPRHTNKIFVVLIGLYLLFLFSFGGNHLIAIVKVDAGVVVPSHLWYGFLVEGLQLLKFVFEFGWAAQHYGVVAYSGC